MSQLTTLLYFEAFQGDSPKNRLWVRSTLMSALSESLNALGILVDLRNCHVACNDSGILPYFHILSIGYINQLTNAVTCFCR